MTDINSFFTKVFSVVGGFKTLWATLIGLCLMSYYWRKGMETLSALGLPDDEAYKPIVWISFCLVFSKLFVSLTVLAWQRVNPVGLWNGRKTRKIKEKEKQNLYKNLFIFFPALPDRKQNILIDIFVENHVSLSKYDKTVRELESDGYIKAIGTSDGSEHVYKLLPEVRDYLQGQMSKKNTIRMNTALEKLTNEQVDFLSIFFLEDTPFGTRESGKVMPLETYNSIMIPPLHDYIEREDDTYFLDKEFAELLAKSPNFPFSVNRTLHKSLDSEFIGYGRGIFMNSSYFRRL